ncbi:methyltransferase [Streptomyces violascens]|uniref:methyltransferase n=1 Tax=Streptomyces violascens TaxID=67381 RepID=UPI00366528D2
MTVTPAADMLRLLGGFEISQALYAVARTGLADLLLSGPRPVTDLAEAAGVRSDLLRRLARTLAAEDVFTLDEAEDTVGLGPLGTTLATGTPESVRNVALMWMETHYLPFAELTQTLRDGSPSADRVLGQPFFDWLGQDPAKVATFSAAMADLLRTLRQDALASLDLAGVGSVVDVGGADGTALAELAERHPDLRGTVFDLPHVVAAATELLSARGVADRVTAVGGDFFASVPGPADCYLACFILHDWPDDRATRILENVRAAAAPGARLFLVETVLGEGTQPQIANLMDLTMMGMLGGRERTRDHWQTLLATAGFRLDRIRPTKGPMCVIEATLQP